MALLPAPSLRHARALIWASAQLGFFPLPLAQAYAWTAAILVYEPDASALKSASNYFDGCSTRFAYSGLHLTNGYDANSGPICKVLLSPVEQSAGCPALCRGDHAERWQKMSIPSNLSKID
jgi:hypothetical protein